MECVEFERQYCCLCVQLARNLKQRSEEILLPTFRHSNTPVQRDLEVLAAEAVFIYLVADFGR